MTTEQFCAIVAVAWMAPHVSKWIAVTYGIFFAVIGIFKAVVP